MSQAGLVQQQDAGRSSPEADVQLVPPGSYAIAPNALRVELIPWADCRALMIANHYSRAAPKTGTLAFGVFVDGQLRGGALFAPGPRSAYRMIVAARPQDVICLVRFWLADELGRNAESRVLGYCLRWLKAHTAFRAIISYADPEQGHKGTIYRATGFEFCGVGESTYLLDLGEGMPLHPRTVSDRYGTDGRGFLHRTGIRGRWVLSPGKLRYVRFLDESWRWRLRKWALQQDDNPGVNDSHSGARSVG